MSLRPVKSLNATNWQRTLQSSLSKFSQFDGTKILLDSANSYHDVLRFDVVDFSGAIDSTVTNALEREFGGMVTLSHEFNPQNSRQKLVAITVTRPESAVLDYVADLHDRYFDEISRWRPHPLLLTVLFLVAFFMTAHSAFLLHNHTEQKLDAFSTLCHFVTHKIASLVYTVSQ